MVGGAYLLQLNEEGIRDWLSYRKCVPTDFSKYVARFTDLGAVSSRPAPLLSPALTPRGARAGAVRRGWVRQRQRLVAPAPSSRVRRRPGLPFPVLCVSGECWCVWLARS